MDWSKLCPSTLWNWHQVIHDLRKGSAEKASQALSDIFILVTLYLSAALLIVVFCLTVKSLVATWKYSRALKRVRNANEYAVVRYRLGKNPRLKLFNGFNHHLVEIPTRAGDSLSELRRSVDAAEIFTDSHFAPGFSSNRFFQALPGFLTGLGVLGTFVGLQFGIGSLNLDSSDKLETSIKPLIKGCSVAFSTSVWGVLCSLVFSFLEKSADELAHWAIHKFQRKIDDLIPRYVPEEAMAELERSSRGSHELLQGLAIAIGEEMQKAIGRLGSEVKDAVVSATKEGQGPLADQAAQLLSSAIAKEIGKLTETVGQMNEQFTTRFSAASDDLMMSVRSIQPVVTALSQAVLESQGTVANAVAKLNAHESVMSRMAEVSKELSAFAQIVQLASQEQTAASFASRDAASAGERASAALAPLPSALSELIKGMTLASRSIDEGSKSALICHRELLTEQQFWFTGAELTLVAFRDNIQSVVESWSAQMEGATKMKVESWANEVAKCLKSYESQVQTLDERLEELQDALSKLRGES